MTLRAYRLACTRSDRRLFCDLDFEIEAGEAMWLAGGNGSGKTSLLRLLCGLAFPDEGEVHWNGRNIRSLREDFYRGLDYYGHAGGVKDDLAAWENLAIVAGLSGRHCSREDACRALDAAGVGHVAHLPARVLSQGQRKLAALARLYLAPMKKLLILDEPFTALDRHAIHNLRSILNRHLAQGSIVVYTTHQEVSLETKRLHRFELQSAAAC